MAYKPNKGDTGKPWTVGDPVPDWLTGDFKNSFMEWGKKGKGGTDKPFTPAGSTAGGVGWEPGGGNLTQSGWDYINSLPNPNDFLGLKDYFSAFNNDWWNPESTGGSGSTGYDFDRYGGPRGNWSGGQTFSRSGRDGNTNQTSMGGVSAVDPQSDLDVQGYIDQSYDAAMNRLNPVFEQNRDAFDQAMINRGISLGSEAYNEVLQQMSQNENDAMTQAAYNAIGLGADLQNQNFMQDATRSQLANALLRSKWNTDLGYAGLDFNYANLGENARQFNDSLGFNYANLGEQGRQFDNTLDFNYFNADRDDMRWLSEFDLKNDMFNEDNMRWQDQMSAGYLSPWGQNPISMNPLVSNQYANNGLYGTGVAGANSWYEALSRWLEGLTDG